MTVKTRLYSPAEADSDGLLGLFRHPLDKVRARVPERTPAPDKRRGAGSLGSGPSFYGGFCAYKAFTLSQTSEMMSALSAETVSVPDPQFTVSLTAGTSLNWTVSLPTPT